MPYGEIEIVGWFDCEQLDAENCHVTLDEEYRSDEYDFVEDHMSEHGWLIIGDSCYCPECKKVLIDG